MANRDPEVFPNPNEIDLDRTGNRHHSFGLGIHRCIGSNVARMVFKRMLTAVLDRMPDYVCDPAGAVHYETIGIIQGMKHLPATFTPGPRIGDGLDETIARMQVVGRRAAAGRAGHRPQGEGEPAQLSALPDDEGDHVAGAAVRPLPAVTPENEFFWTSGADGRLRFTGCTLLRRADPSAAAGLPVLPGRASSGCGRSPGSRRCRASPSTSGSGVPGLPAPYVIAAGGDRGRPAGPADDERRRLRPGRPRTGHADGGPCSSTP